MTRARTAFSGLLVLTLLVGCGGDAWDVHAFTALGLRDAANAARDTYRESRIDHMRDAGMRARTAGGDDATVGAAVDAAAVEFDAEYADLRDGHALFSTASTAYTTAVYAALRGQAGDANEIVAVGRAAIEAYNHVAAILERHGLPDLPELPPGIAEFLRVLLPGDEQ